jgi:hypothetical protein
MKRKLTLTQSALPVLKAVVSINTKTSLPILQHVQVSEIDGQTFAVATDLDMFVIAPIEPIAAGLYKIIGKELVPAIVKDAWRFPVMPEWFATTETANLPVQVISDALPFVSEEQSRYTLNGFLLQIETDGKVTVVATDGHRLRVQNAPKASIAAGQYLIPRKAGKLLARFVKGNVQAAIKDEHIRFVSDSFVLVTRKMTGTFPNYRAIMPRDMPLQYSVATEDLLAAIETLKPFLKVAGSATGVLCAFTDGVLSVTAAKGSEYERTVQMPYRTHPSAMGFQYERYLAMSPQHAINIVMPLRAATPDKTDAGVPPYFNVNLEYLHDVVVTMPETTYIGWKDHQSQMTFAGYPVDTAAAAAAESESEAEAAVAAAVEAAA